MYIIPLSVYKQSGYIYKQCGYIYIYKAKTMLLFIFQYTEIIGRFIEDYKMKVPSTVKLNIVLLFSSSVVALAKHSSSGSTNT